jgi:uncharacterized spore protein YtfJ
MTETTGELAAALEGGREVGREMTEKIFAAARPGAVFGEPVRVGDRTLITASEVVAGGGFGFGGGAGTGPGATTGAPGTAAGTGGAGARQRSGGGGGGAGGGGGSLARPVAVIVAGPDGVTIRPVVDVTKLAIACATAWGAVALALARMSRVRRR